MDEEIQTPVVCPTCGYEGDWPENGTTATVQSAGIQ